MTTFKVGDTFPSWDAFFFEFDKFIEESRQPFIKYNSRLAVNSNIQLRKRATVTADLFPEIESLKYSLYDLRCKHTGSYESKSKGPRVYKSVKSGCPARIYARVDKKRECVVLKYVELEHNHPIDDTQRVRTSHTRESLVSACETVWNGSCSVTEAAKIFGVHKSTLHDRVKGKKALQREVDVSLNAEEEKTIKDWYIAAEEKGFQPTLIQIKRAVHSLLGSKDDKSGCSMPSKFWVESFLERHNLKQNKFAPSVNFERQSIYSDNNLANMNIKTSGMATTSKIGDDPSGTSDFDLMGVSFVQESHDQFFLQQIKSEVDAEMFDESIDHKSDVQHDSSSFRLPPPSDHAVSTTTSSLSIKADSSESVSLPNTFINSLPGPSHPNMEEFSHYSSQTTLDRLLDLVAQTGIEKLVRYRNSLDYKLREQFEPEEALFRMLYSRIVNRLLDKDSGGGKKVPFFDNEISSDPVSYSETQKLVPSNNTDSDSVESNGEK